MNAFHLAANYKRCANRQLTFRYVCRGLDPTKDTRCQKIKNDTENMI